jgi:acetolactate synthase I/II/III large subunit
MAISTDPTSTYPDTAISRRKSRQEHTITPIQRTGAQIMCDALERERVKIMFGYPGGAIMPFYDALSSSSLRHVLVRHEQAAAHAADGYARATGKVGVCIATSGPGATNLVTGLATAFMDSVPVVAITGQVASHLIGTDGFQETDVIGVTQAVTKHNILVRSVDELADAIHDAFVIAASGRPGPVVVDVPKDVQQATTTVMPSMPKTPATRTIKKPDEAAIERAMELIATAERPIILAGHGVILAEAYTELREFAERTQIPVVTTLLGISAFPTSHPLFIGWPGMHGFAEVNHAIHASDLLIAVGMRFDDRVTGKVNQFAPDARIIHIDIDPTEMGKVLAPTVPIVADARAALSMMADRARSADHSEWMQSIKSWSQEPEFTRQPTTDSSDSSLPRPRDILKAIREATQDEAIIVTDVGQHQMWTAGHYGSNKPNSHITSGGAGTMGFALPAAMGVIIGKPSQPVWVIAGDGGIQMNIQELATITEHNMPIKIAVFNNGYLGMVRQWQEIFHQRNYSETRITSPDFVKLADAYGMRGFNVTCASDVQTAIEEAMAIDGPTIINFVIEQEANVFPMVAPGKPNVQMLHKSPTVGGSNE